jgi:hypothetical protein
MVIALLLTSVIVATLRRRDAPRGFPIEID